MPRVSVVRAGVACVLLVAPAMLLVACGKEPNLHPRKLVEFDSAIPFTPRALATPETSPWTSGRALAVTEDHVWVVDRDNGALVLMNRGPQAPLEVEETLPIGPRPEQVVVGPGGDALVTVRYAGEVVRVAPGMVEAARVKVGAETYGIALSPDGATAYVTLPTAGELVVLDAHTLEELDRVFTLELPRGLAVGRFGGELLVTHQRDEALRFTLDLFGLPDVGGERLVPLRRGNPADLLVSDRHAQTIPQRALAVTTSPESGAFLIAHVQSTPGSERDFVEAMLDRPVDAERSAPGGYGAAVSLPGAAFDIPFRPIEPSITAVQPMGELEPVMASRPVADPLTGEPMSHLLDQPSDIAHHPTWTMAFVTGYGSDTVLVLNTAFPDPMISPIALIEVGHAPRAVALSPDGAHAYVLNDHQLTVSEIDLARLFAMPTRSDGDGESVTARASAGVPEVLRPTFPVRMRHTRAVAFGADPLPPAVRRGARVFTFARNERMSHAGEFACASCHFEGTEDKLVWFITDGPRQTPSLAGRLDGTEPFNWAGTEPDLKGNMRQTVDRMGGSGLTRDELADLEQFLLRGLVPPPNPHLAEDGSLTELQAWGKEIFHDPDVRCATCHRPSQEFTDGFVHDVGTASQLELDVWEQRLARGEDPGPRPGRLNTPSLRGLYYTAPYLHDGSAGTLMEVLERTAETMGETWHLSRQEKEALIAYLLTL